MIRPKTIARCVPAYLALLVCLAGPTVAHGQSPAAPSAAVRPATDAVGSAAVDGANGPQEIDALLARLTDAQARALLAETLRREAAARIARERDRSVEIIRETVANYDVVVLDNLMRMSAAIVVLPDALAVALATEAVVFLWIGLLSGAGLARAAVLAGRRPDQQRRGRGTGLASILLLVAGGAWGVAGALSFSAAEADVARTAACLAMIVTAAAASVLVVRHRHSIEDRIAGPDGAAADEGRRLSSRRTWARRMPAALVAGIVVLAFVWVMNLMAGDITAVWSIQWAFVGLAALVALDRQLPPLLVFLTLGALTSRGDRSDAGFADPARQPTERDDFVPAARRSFRALALAGLVLGVPQVAGYDVIQFLETDLGGRFWTIGTSMIVSYVFWQVLRAGTDRYVVRRTVVGPVDEDERVGGVGRAATLVPLLRLVASTILVLLVTVTTLSNSGIDVTPLLASAGILGLAIGFGAQTLVRDIVSGIFFLIDDAFRVGEYVEFGDLRGTVEGITLRSVKLRHHLGQLQTIPFGELRSVSNHSRDWVIYKMDFRLPFETDIEKVRKLIKSIGADLLQHPELGSDFIDPLKSQGVVRVEDTALVIRVKFTAKPHKQFGIRKEALRRIQLVFAENGISLAPTRVVVQSDGGSAGAAVAATGQPSA